MLNTKRLLQTSAFFLLVLATFQTFSVNADETPISWTPELMITHKRVGTTALSPDGKLIAYTVSRPLLEREQSENLTHISIVSSDSNLNYQFTHGKMSGGTPSFSPDGTFLAFVSSHGADKKRQVWLSPLTDGEAEQLTSAKSGINSCNWSPDGKRIAYTMNDVRTEKEERNKREKLDMRVLDTNFKYSHIYTIEIENKPDGKRKIQRLTSGNFHVTSFDWSPDGTSIVFTHRPTPSPDDWLSEDISTVVADSGAVRELVTWKGTDRLPRYSPDGRWIAFVSDCGEPDWALLSDVYIVPARGGEPRSLARTPDRSFTYYGKLIGWSADSSELYVRESNRTNWRIFAIPVDGGKVRMVTTAPGSYSGASLSSKKPFMAYVHQTSDSPADVYITSTEQFRPKKLTDIHADYPVLPMGKTEVISWKSSDNLEIEGLLTYPLDYVSGRSCPLILHIHGGPHSFFRESFTGAGSTYPIQAFAQEGYAVLRPNPRGSSGYGKEFRYANYKDWGFGDFEDCMAGVDKVIAMGIAHPDSLCVTGWSYGGYMTSFIVTKTNRFKAAVMGAGLSNLMSFTATSDIPSFIPNYFGGEYWDRMETYMKHSANFHVKSVTTPTLILHGELDRRVPLNQGLEFYHALKRQGCTTEMVVYPRTHHGLREPKFIVDGGKRILAWFNEHLERKRNKGRKS